MNAIKNLIKRYQLASLLVLTLLLRPGGLLGARQTR